MGESGAGKSTILSLLMALSSPSAGQVEFRGAPLRRVRASRMREFRRSVQLVFQDPRSSLDPRMSVDQILREPLESLVVPGDHRARVAELLEAVGLTPDMAARYPGEFSGGQRQRIAIARALAPSPQVLVADEPVSALDVSVRAQIIELLARLKDELGMTPVTPIRRNSSPPCHSSLDSPPRPRGSTPTAHRAPLHAALLRCERT